MSPDDVKLEADRLVDIARRAQEVLAPLAGQNPTILLGHHFAPEVVHEVAKRLGATVIALNLPAGLRSEPTYFFGLEWMRHGEPRVDMFSLELVARAEESAGGAA